MVKYIEFILVTKEHGNIKSVTEVDKPSIGYTDFQLLKALSTWTASLR
jgi:hypothetical protein